MLNWYRALVREYGTATATRHWVQAFWSAMRFRIGNRYLRVDRECPCCGWSGHRFRDYLSIDYVYRDAECPGCSSHPRHRMLYLWLRDRFAFESRQGLAMIFAPEVCLMPLLTSTSRLKCVRIDIETRRGVDLVGDAQRLPIGDGAVDLIWCHHVLEHIEDDTRALREMRRILRPGSGELIVSVPMGAGPRTDEYGFCNERISGHWRLYGDDFPEKLVSCGFSVQPLLFEVTEADAKRYGIRPEPIYSCR
jgi:SAM-dependent methyltransferase